MEIQVVHLFLPAVVVMAVLIVVIIYLHGKTKSQQIALGKKQTIAHQLGANQARGDIYQILGTFSILADYDQLGFISTASKQMSVDMIGIKSDGIDFIEFKKKGADLKPGESKIKKLVEAKLVHYQIKDVELPAGLCVENRSTTHGGDKNRQTTAL
ncbi:MAG: hypothetical protein WAO91_08735 [Candidatus Nitrosotenuis sp.]